MAANPFAYAVTQVQKKAQQLFNPVGQAISRVPQQFGNYIQKTPQYQGAQMYQKAFQSPQVQNFVRQAPTQVIRLGQSVNSAVNAPYNAVNRQMAPVLQQTRNMPLMQRVDTVLPKAAKAFSSNLLPGYVPNVVNPLMDLGYNAAKSAAKPFIPSDVKKYYGIRETGFEDVGNIAGGLGAANIPGNIVGGAIGVGMNRLPVVGSNGKVSDAQAFDEGFKFSAKLGPLGKLAETPLKGLLNKINPKTVNTVNSLVSQKLYKEAAKLLVRRAGASAVSGGVGFGVYNTTLPAKNLQERVANALEGIATGAAFGAGTSIGGDVLGTGAKQLQRIYKNKPKLGMQSADAVMAPTDILISHEGAPDKARVEYYKKLIQSGKKVDPIVIINEGAKYGIEDGKHRFQAYKELGYNQVPVIFKGGEEYQQMMARAESSVKLPTQVEGLAKEASKYKSAEEFVKAQINAYHGTNKSFDKFELTEGKRTGGMGAERTVKNNAIFLSNDRNVADFFGKNRSEVQGGYNRVIEAKIPQDKILDLNKLPSDVKRKAIDLVERWTGDKHKSIPADLRSWLVDQSEFVDLVKSKGFKGVRFNEGSVLKGDRYTLKTQGGNYTTAIFDPKDILTKSQLTDIFNQSKGVQNADLSIKLPVAPQVVNGKIKMRPVKGSDTFAAEMEKIKLQNAQQPVQTRPPAQEFSQAEAGQMGGMSEANAQFDQKGLKGLIDKWVGKKNSSRTTGAVEGSKYMNIPKEQTGDVIKSLEGNKTNATAGTVKEIRAKFDALYNQAKKDGIDIGYRENYVPHYWSAPEGEVKQMYQVFKQREGFQNRRLIPTYEEGLKMGLSPRYNNPAQIIEQYVSKMEQLKNNLDLFKSLKNQGFIVPASVGRQKGFVPIDAYGFPKSNSVVGEGKVIIGDYYAPVEVADMLRKVFNPQTDTGIIGGVVDRAAKASGVLQDVGLSGGVPGTPLNAFGTMQTLKDVMGGNFSAVKNFFRSVSPQATEKKILSQAGTIAKMQERNIPVRSPDLSELIDGATVNRTVGEKVGGKWNRLVNDPTFKRMMTQNQIDFFEKIEKAALKGGKNSQEAADIAAAAVKQFYGTSNTGSVALQSKIGKDVTRTFLFAPKFRESMVNFWVNNIKALKNPAALQNRGNAVFMGSAIVMAGTMDYLNRQLNGHGMLQNPKGNEDKLLVPVGKLTGNPDDQTVIGIPFLSSIATIPRALFRELLMLGQGDVAGAGRDAFQSYASMLVKPAADVIANQDYFGKEIVKDTDTTGDKFTKQGKYLATQYLGHPYLKEAFDTRNQDDPLYQRVSRALELPFRFKTTDSLTKSAFYDEYYKLKPYGEEFETLKYKDPQAAQDFLNKNADKLTRLAELKTRQDAYYDSGAQANPQAISVLDTKTKLQDVQFGGFDLEKEKFRQSNKNILINNNNLYYKKDGEVNTVKLNQFVSADPIRAAKERSDQQSNIKSAGTAIYWSDMSQKEKEEAYKALGTTAQDVEMKAIDSFNDDEKAPLVYKLLQDRVWKQEKVDAFIKSDVLTDNVIKKMEDQGLINEAQAKDLKAYVKNQNVKLGKVAAPKGKKPKKLKIPKLKAIKVKYSKLKIKMPKPKKFKSLKVRGGSSKRFATYS